MLFEDEEESPSSPSKKSPLVHTPLISDAINEVIEESSVEDTKPRKQASEDDYDDSDDDNNKSKKKKKKKGKKEMPGSESEISSHSSFSYAGDMARRGGA